MTFLWNSCQKDITWIQVQGNINKLKFSDFYGVSDLYFSEY